MKLVAKLGLLIVCLGLCGCKLTAQEYNNEHSPGHFSVKGEIESLASLSSESWEHLSDGFAIVIAGSGGSVTIRQMVGDQPGGKKTTFNLVEGDHVIIGEKTHFILSSLDQKEGSGGAGSMPPDDGDDGDDGDDMDDGGDGG